MSKTETVIEFKKNVNELLEFGEKKVWIEAESSLASPTMKQILEWEDENSIPMRASTLAKLQDFNKRYAMGAFRPSSKKQKNLPSQEKIAENSKAETVKIPYTDHQYAKQVNNVVDKPGLSSRELTIEELERTGAKWINKCQGPSYSIDEAIVMLNRACRERGITCKVIMEAV